MGPLIGRRELIRSSEQDDGRGNAARAWAIGVIFSSACLSVVINWPGHLSYDSVLQLAEGRAGSYSGAHPPVMSWLLGVGDAIVHGASLFIALQTSLIAGALIGLLTLGRRVGWATPAACLIFVATPQMLIYPSIVWKDVLFAGSAAAGFTALALAAAGWRMVAARLVWLWLAALLLVLATLTRQNGAVILPFAALALGWIASRARARTRVARGLIYGLTFLAITGGLAALVETKLNQKIDPEIAPASPWRALHAYDLVNALDLEPRTPLPVLHAKAPWLETILRREGVTAYSPVRADPLQSVLDQARAHGDVEGPLDSQWRDLILRQPLLYLRARTRTFAWVFLTPDHDRCLLIYTGVDGEVDDMADAGLKPRKSAWDDALADAALFLAPSPVYSHAAYGALAVLLLGLLLWRRRATDIAVAAMIAAALTFTASFAVISIACDYRYLYALDIAAVAAAIYVTATWRNES